MTTKENFIEKEIATISEDMKQKIIDYVSFGSAKVEQFEVGADNNYVILYTTTCPRPNGNLLFKNNQFAEPFNQYYQKLLTDSPMLTDLNGFFLSQKIEDLHLEPEQIGYLRINYPKIITVQDFLNQGLKKYKYHLTDPYMEHIKNILMCFEAITSLVITKNKESLNTDDRKESLPRLEIEEKDCRIAQEFLKNSVLSREEFAELFKQLQLIHQSIDFSTLREFSYLRLKNSKKDKCPNLTMELDDEKDGIYKQVTISIENQTTSIEQCKGFKDSYFIFECIEFWSEYQTYFSRKLLKTNSPKLDNVIALVYKEWVYNSVEQSLEEMPSLDFTGNISKEKKEYLGVSPDEQKHYLRCLSKNKGN